MFEPRLRKVALKRALDATLYRGVARGAAAVVVASEREAETVVDAGVAAEKVRVRGNGFPEPFGSAVEPRLALAPRHFTARRRSSSTSGESPREKESSTCSTQRASFATHIS